MKCLISVILYQQNYSCVEKEYSELLCLTKNSSLLKNRHFPVAMVTEWDKGVNCLMAFYGLTFLDLINLYIINTHL